MGRVIISKKAPKGKQQMEMALKIVRGIEYLHDRRIVHGDVKPSNVLTSNGEIEVEVCAFGMSRVKTTPANNS